jgi:type II secretory pathway component GspD/PulD (secretin)
MRSGRHLRATRAAILGALLLVGVVWRAPAAQAEGPKPDKNAKAGAEVELRDYYFLRDDLVRNQDGTVTWFYVTNHVGATTLKKSLDQLKVPGLQTMTRGRDTFRVAYDLRARSVNLAAPPTRTVGIDENVLLLTFPPGYKDIVEEFLERFDIAEPQVYIKAKVVEVTLDSNLEYGVSWFFDRGGGDPSTGVPGTDNPNAFFRAFRSQFRPGSFTGAPLSPENTGLSLLFDDLTMDEGTITATIDALQERGSANILSEPSIVATQGQLATLVTGEETPVQEIKVTGASETITTIFKPTGIQLDFHPLHIGREFVKLRVRVEVSSITGFVTAVSTNFVVQNPVIAQRNAESVVTIRDGMTLVIGGLYAVSEIEDKAGVPIIGDIPVLGWLFSKKKKTKVKSELDFFITPRILRQRLAKTVFVPPSEKERLERLKGEQGSAKKGE